MTFLDFIHELLKIQWSKLGNCSSEVVSTFDLNHYCQRSLLLGIHKTVNVANKVSRKNCAHGQNIYLLVTFLDSLTGTVVHIPLLQNTAISSPCSLCMASGMCKSVQKRTLLASYLLLNQYIQAYQFKQYLETKDPQSRHAR